MFLFLTTFNMSNYTNEYTQCGYYRDLHQAQKYFIKSFEILENCIVLKGCYCEPKSFEKTNGRELFTYNKILFQNLHLMTR